MCVPVICTSETWQVMPITSEKIQEVPEIGMGAVAWKLQTATIIGTRVRPIAVIPVRVVQREHRVGHQPGPRHHTPEESDPAGYFDEALAALLME